ncbi:hypothetical protein ACO3VM_09470 (plasmid) [Methanocaldococcus sp. 10A]
MDTQTAIFIIGLFSLGLIALASIGLYLWYFKFGGKKLVEEA